MDQYDSLLLNYSSGITVDKQMSKQYTGSAALAIGIGGVGIAALAELKHQVCQQLLPDNPDSPIPRYDHIQLLAIDSDEDSVRRMRGKSRLDISSEFFSIYNSHLRAELTGKIRIKSDPRFDWMDIDRIDHLLSPEGAGCRRQVGRFLLISKAQLLYNKIREKCVAALSGLPDYNLDVYIFAGLSGGTGGGCFLDTCYILRQVLEDCGWGSTSRITGLFFLPDVVTSRPDVRSNTALCQWNHSNGYAALKELDYLMDLRGAQDRMRQDYGCFSINTQDPPVDFCYLLSTIKADGSVLENGYAHCIHTAARYVMTLLTEENSQPRPGSSVLRDHLNNLRSGIQKLPAQWGNRRFYQSLGACSVEIPWTRIATYLAAGFEEKFQSLVGREKFSLAAADAHQYAADLGLTFNNLFSDLQRDCQALSLPDIDQGMLRKMGAMPKGQLPQPWAVPGNAWCNTCAGVREKNRVVLNGRLESYNPAQVSENTLLGKVFRQLCSLAKAPACGPYYAAALLDQLGYDLFSVIDGIIKEAEGHASDARLQLQGNAYGGGLEQRIVQASIDFCHPSLLERFTPGKLYEDYKNTVEEWYRFYNMAAACDEVVYTLRRFRDDLKDLRRAYFEPMIRMLDALHNTFQANKTYLNSDAADRDAVCTSYILDFQEMKPQLDMAIDALSPNTVVADFLDAVMSEPDEWLTGNEETISQFISNYMLKVFQAPLDRSLEDYLLERFPTAVGNANRLTQFVQDDILQQAYSAAVPIHWFIPDYNPESDALPFSLITVPESSPIVISAAAGFRACFHDVLTRKVASQGCISLLRLYSGFPLKVCQCLPILKRAYDQLIHTSHGASLHLYANTGRDHSGNVSPDWALLPSPLETS